ncbi:hypothetical protein D3C77_505020 [compost metagenome]
MRQLCPGFGGGRAVGAPGLSCKLLHRFTDGLTLWPQPGQYIRCQLPDTDKTLHAGHPVDLDQFQPWRQPFQAGQQANQEQLIVGVGFAPEHCARAIAQQRQLTVLIRHSLSHLGALKAVGLADVVAAQAVVVVTWQVAYRPHAQRIAEHVKRPVKAGQAQAVTDVVTATPVLAACFIVGDELGVASGKIDGVDMGLELGPAGKAQVASDQALSIGQTWRGCSAQAQVLEQFLGALALLFKVDAAIFGRR